MWHLVVWVLPRRSMRMPCVSCVDCEHQGLFPPVIMMVFDGVSVFRWARRVLRMISQWVSSMGAQF